MELEAMLRRLNYGRVKQPHPDHKRDHPNLHAALKTNSVQGFRVSGSGENNIV